MKILIKGAGDLATGIALRLYHCGHRILMTEIPIPLTVRRTVAFSRAVYERRARVEDVTAELAFSYEDAEHIMEEGNIAVVVDPQADIRRSFRPDVLVDAILAKKNLGTAMTDAPLVVGVGPGFTAGEDCHCVVETKRGHTLGRVIWRGSAIPNTGVPGNVGGYTTERLLRASGAGKMEPTAHIGDRVEKGQIVAYTGGKPVYAAMSGLVRGMLQAGVDVTERLKIGDIDVRCEPEHCRTVSDKALSIGGGVLEAILAFEKQRGKYAVCVLAAGLSSRFGGDKLLADFRGKPLYRHMLDKLEVFSETIKILVTNREEIREEAKKQGVYVVWNSEPKQGISHSMKLGLAEALKQRPDIEGVLFCVCDQPGLSSATMLEMFRLGSLKTGKIIRAAYDGTAGNPVLWPRKYFQELAKLTGDEGGCQILRKYREQALTVEAGREELEDIDVPEDMKYIIY